jgi:hypothetical protein
MKGDIVRIQNSEELLKRLRTETDERVKRISKNLFNRKVYILLILYYIS